MLILLSGNFVAGFLAFQCDDQENIQWYKERLSEVRAVELFSFDQLKEITGEKPADAAVGEVSAGPSGETAGPATSPDDSGAGEGAGASGAVPGAGDVTPAADEPAPGSQ